MGKWNHGILEEQKQTYLSWNNHTAAEPQINHFISPDSAAVLEMEMIPNQDRN